MSDLELQAFINAWIYTNGNNEITAATLNPVLQAIRERINDVSGNLDDLTTSDTTNLVAAINSIQEALENINADGIMLHSGTENPNTTPPLSFNIADFYIQQDIDNNPVALWQYNGTEWVTSGNITNTSSLVNDGEDGTHPFIYQGYGTFMQRIAKGWQYIGSILTFNSLEEDEKGDIFRGQKEIDGVVYIYPETRWNGIGDVQDIENHYYSHYQTILLDDEI